LGLPWARSRSAASKVIVELGNRNDTAGHPTR
jgi:hypothetical protein